MLNPKAETPSPKLDLEDMVKGETPSPKLDLEDMVNHVAHLEDMVNDPLRIGSDRTLRKYWYIAAFSCVLATTASSGFFLPGYFRPNDRWLITWLTCRTRTRTRTREEERRG